MKHISQTKSISLKANMRIFWALSIFLIIGLVGLLTLQVQLLAQRSEFVSRTQKELTDLSEGNTEQEFSFSSNEMSELAQLAQDLSFEKIDKVHYIRAIESTVLAR